MQKMMGKKWGRLPTSPQEPGPRTNCRAEAIRGHPARSPHPGGRRFTPEKGAWRPRPPRPQPSPARPAQRAHCPLSTRPRAPRPPSARPRRPSGPRPRLLSGSPWPGTVSTGPQTASKNFERRRREVGHAEPATHGRGSAGPPPPPEPQLQLAPAPPGPAPSAPSQARAVVAPRLPG